MHVVMMDLFELLWQLTIEYICLWHFIFIHHIIFLEKVLPYAFLTIFYFISFIIINMF
jgi:hypothetical protein